MVWNIWDFVCLKEQGRLRDRGNYSSFITSIISFMPSLNPAMNISRSEIEDISVTDYMSLSNISFCSSESDSLNKSSFLSASAFSF